MTHGAVCLQAASAAERPLQLLSLHVATWLSDGLSTRYAEDAITANSIAAAVQSLPYTLPALLRSKAWISQRPAVCMRLCRILAVKSGAASVHETATVCLLALRDHAPTEAWDVISRQVACAEL